MFGLQTFAHAQLVKAMALDEERYPPKQAAYFISSSKEEGLRPQNIDAPDPHTAKLIEVYAAYEAQCQREGVVDFGELMLLRMATSDSSGNADRNSPFGKRRAATARTVSPRSSATRCSRSL